MKKTPKKRKKKKAISEAKVTMREQAFFDLGNTVHLPTKSWY